MLLQTALHIAQILLHAVLEPWCKSKQVLEKARTGKLLGAALEAKVLLYVGNPTLKQKLAALDAQSNGADPLRYTFITSQVTHMD